MQDGRAVSTLVELLNAFDEEIEKSLEALRPQKGMGFTDLGEFHAPPSTLGRLKRWSRDFREAAGLPSAAELKAGAYVLRAAADEFGNHGCNDLDLVGDVGLTPEESYKLRCDMALWANDVGADPEEPSNHMTMDWLVMLYIADRTGMGSK